MAVPNIHMNNGMSIPQLGYGLWRIDDEKECKDAIRAALEAGYTHFDGAQVYGNEQYLGEVMKESGVNRAELFVTTKIWTKNMEDDRVAESYDESLQKLQTEDTDLLLLHFPVSNVRHAAWEELQKILASGRTKSIGVSNYTIRHLEEMKDFEIKPAVNQVELSVALQQPELLEYCKANAIVVEAYTPLAEGYMFDDQVLNDIAKKHHKTVPQIMLRWGIEYGVVVLTKSAKPERIRENFDIFDFQLDEEDMDRLKSLDRNLRTNWDPTDTP